MTIPEPNTTKPRRIAIFIAFSGRGGVERMVLNLARGFAEAGHHVDLLVVKGESAHLRAVAPGIDVRRFTARHTATALPELIRYLRTERPDTLLAAKERAIRIALLARRIAGVPCRLVGRLGTTVSAALAGKGRLRRALWYLGMRLTLPHVDRIVAVSAGVADDVYRITGLGAPQVVVIRNPVITPELEELAHAPLDHAWFAPDAPPVILGAGRLTAQKDFPTLLRAFAQVAAQRPCRLIIIGEGRERGTLEALATQLGVRERFELPGFQANPFAWLARTRLFVLSSAWEGSPNVLTEAMALGTPVVATDCPSGPRELLDGGRIAPLVPVGDASALARAMQQALDHPPNPIALHNAVREYTVARSAARYLESQPLVTP